MHLTGMTAQTKLSAKGQVVIPKDVRDRLGWTEGTVFDVIQTADGVFLRRPSWRKRISAAEALARIREVYRYEGPPIPIEKLSWSPDVDDSDLDPK